MTNEQIELAVSQSLGIVKPIYDAGHTELADQVLVNTVAILTPGAPLPELKADRQRIIDLVHKFLPPPA